MFNENQIAFFDAFALHELFASFGNITDIFMPHNYRIINRRLGIEFHIRTTDPGNLHLKQRAVFGHIRHIIFPIFGFMWAGTNRRLNFFRQRKVSLVTNEITG